MPPEPPNAPAAESNRRPQPLFGAPPAIPDHTLLRRIGAGSYGEVWLARNILGTHRAVKLVWRHTFDSDRPYDREFNGIQKFEPISRTHEGLVDVLQIGRNNDEGYFYYVMELADSARSAACDTQALGRDGAQGVDPATYRPRTLRSEIERRGRLPFEECLKFLLMITGGLGALHRQGLIHRDIKPSNIIIVNGDAKLADIGLVAEASERRSFVGTEGFIAPEGPGSVQADIYSMGKVLYEAATGNDRLKFPSLPPDPATGRIDNALLELNTVLLRACASDPAERYPSAAELHGDLLLLQSGRSVKRLRLLESRLRFARRAGAVTGLVALLAVAGFLAAGYREKLARENNDRLQKALDRATAADLEAKRRLYQALAATAMAERRSGVVGQRFSTLEAIVSAAQLRPGEAELRDAAISALAIPDFREVRRVPVPGAVLAKTFASDLETVFFVATNGLIQARRVSDGADLYALDPAGPGPVEWLRNPGGSARWLLAGRRDATIDLWDVVARKIVLRLPSSYHCVVSADDRWLADLTRTGRVRIYELATGSSREAPLEPVFDLLSPGAADCFPVASRQTNLVSVVEFSTGAVRTTIRTPEEDTIHSVALSPDGRTVLVNYRGGHVQVYDADEPGVPRSAFAPHSNAISFAKFHPDGDWCVTGSWDGTMRLLGVNEGRPLAVLRDITEAPIFSPDGRRAGWLNHTTGLGILEVVGREACRVLGERIPGVDDLPGPWNAAFLPDGRLLATSCSDGIRLYETRVGRQVAHIPSTNWYAVSFAGPSALYAAGVNGVSRWRLEWPGPDEVVVRPEERLSQAYQWHLSGSADGSMVAAFGSTNVTLFTADRPPRAFPHHMGIRGGFLSPDGRRFSAAQASTGLVVWDTATGDVVRRFPARFQGGTAFNPRGARVALNDQDAAVVYDLDTGGEVWRTPLQGAPGSASWSPDGRMLAIQRDGILCILLNADTGAVLARLEHPDPRPYNAIAFSPDGGQLACASPAHFVHLWDLRVLRRELAALKLDWDQPPMPPPAAGGPEPRVRLAGH